MAKRRYALLAVACSLSLVAGTSETRAATATATMTVTATVLSLCVIAATPLLFSNYTTAVDNATATLTVTCTLNTTYNVGLDPGTSTGATVTTRAMTSGANLLHYALYRDAAHTLNWGQTVGTDTLAGTGTGLPQLLTVYGQIPANENAAAGVYTDTVTATITY